MIILGYTTKLLIKNQEETISGFVEDLVEEHEFNEDNGDEEKQENNSEYNSD